MRGGPPEFPTPMAEPSPFLLWDATLSLRTSASFNSNPSLAYLGEFRQPAAYFEYGGDLMFYRVGREVNVTRGGSDHTGMIGPLNPA